MFWVYARVQCICFRLCCVILGFDAFVWGCVGFWVILKCDPFVLGCCVFAGLCGYDGYSVHVPYMDHD